MAKLLFEVFYLNLCLLNIKAKTLILRFKLIFSECRCRKFLFKNSVLVVRKHNTFFEYGRRAMLVNKLFNTVKQTHEPP